LVDFASVLYLAEGDFIDKLITIDTKYDLHLLSLAFGLMPTRASCEHRGKPLQTNEQPVREKTMMSGEY
jgi:hypothetical protein